DSGGDPDSFADCSIHQLGGVRPPVMCAAGWGGQASIDYPGATYEVYLTGDGDLTVRVNIPMHDLTGTPSLVIGELGFHCFAPGGYPRQELKATIQPLDEHVLDLAPWNEEVLYGFEGSATCTGGVVDLQLQDWMFAPAPPQIFPALGWYTPTTEKVIYNAGPNSANKVRVRKTLNVPWLCQGSVTVAYANETISITGGTQYDAGSGWTDGPAELTGLPIDHIVYVLGAPPWLLSEDQPELLAYFEPVDSLGVGQYIN
ncbi:unnamed protein product, partial [marine sediment metagenome]